MGLNTIVNVQISRQTSAPTQVGFGVALVLDSSGTLVGDKVQSFGSISAIEDAGYVAADDVHKAASRLFGQQLKPEEIKVGRRDADVAQVNNVDVVGADDGTYRVTINGTDFDFVASSSTTAAISAGLIAAINGGSEPVTAAPGAGDSLDLTADVAGDPFTVAVSTITAPSANLVLTETTPNTNISTELADIVDFDDDWYALISDDRTAKNIERAADFVEPRVKIYLAASSDADIFTSATTDIISTLKAKALDRTAVIALKNGVTEFPEAAWAGLQLPRAPGSSTWAFKTLSGITVDTLTDGEISNVEGKNGNIYITKAGVNVTLGTNNGGVMVSGEYIDVIRGIDKSTARLQERIFGRLINLPKIPYTNQGVAIIEAEVRGQLEEDIGDGIFAADPEPTVTVPDVNDVSTANKAARILPDVKYTATLAGAIHKVLVEGTVVL